MEKKPVNFSFSLGAKKNIIKTNGDVQKTNFACVTSFSYGCLKQLKTFLVLLKLQKQVSHFMENYVKIK